MSCNTFIHRLGCNVITRGTLLEHIIRKHHLLPAVLSGQRLFYSSKAPSDDNEKEETKVNKETWSTAWVPPNRPLSGDLGESSHTYDTTAEESTKVESDEDEELRQLLEEDEELRRLLEEEESFMEDENESESEEENEDDDTVVDWLQTRRSKLKGQMLGTASQDQLDVIKHTLLSRNEIISLLERMGGQHIVEMNQYQQHMGAMILTTCPSPMHISTIADTIVENLKKRELADMGVVGAQFGSEGSVSKQETWRIVDCSNFVVHLMTESTRQHLQLEKLWTQEQGDDLRKISLTDEDAMDDYVADNPIPDDYFSSLESDAQWTTEAITKSLRRKRWDEPTKSRNKQSKRSGRKMPRRNR